MKTAIFAGALAVGVLVSQVTSASVVLDFEGINSGNLGSDIPQGYGGLTWESAAIFHQDGLANLDGASSGVWSGFVNPPFFNTRAASATPFTAESIFLTGNINQSDSLLIEGFVYDPQQQFPVLSYSLLLTPTTTPTEFELGFENINELRFTAVPVVGATSPRGLAYDDLQIDGDPTPFQGSLPAKAAKVSEAPSWALLSAGLIPLLRRKSRAVRS